MAAKTWHKMPPTNSPKTNSKAGHNNKSNDQYIAELTQQLKQLTTENEKLQKYQQEAEKKKDSLHRMFGEDNPK